MDNNQRDDKYKIKHGAVGDWKIVDEDDYTILDSNDSSEALFYVYQNDAFGQLQVAVRKLITAWDNSPSSAGHGMEASFYDAIQEMRDIVGD